MSEWIVRLIEQSGELGIAFLMFLETVFPPIPSEIIMSIAGMAAAKGKLSMAGAIAAGTAGAMLGNLLWYLAARALGQVRLKALVDDHGHWLTMNWAEVQRGEKWFARHGAVFTLFGRMIPTIRSLVSIPAGLLKMRFSTFMIASTIGTAAWTALLAWGGYALGKNFDHVEHWLGVASTLVVVALVVIYGWRLAGTTRARRR